MIIWANDWYVCDPDECLLVHELNGMYMGRSNRHPGVLFTNALDGPDRNRPVYHCINWNEL